VAARGGGVVVVAPAAEPRALASRIAAALAERDVTITIGIAPDPVQVDGLEDALSDARRAAHAAASSGRRGDVVSRQDLGIHALLHEDHGELRTFAERLLHPLLDYDDTHDSNLLATLDAYLDSGGNATETARRLILHVNSLYYRLGRIRELGAYDLDDPDTRFELQLALRVLRAAT